MSYDAGTKLGSHLSIGKIIQVNPATYTCLVNILAGRSAGTIPECSIRTLSQNPVSKSGVFFLPEIGDEVFLDWSYGGTPVITDYTPVINTEDEYEPKVTGIRSFGGEDKFHEANGTKHYRHGPSDLMPGDKIIMGRLRNFVGVLAGGLTVIKGGSLSQIILCKVRQLVRIVAKNFEIVTDFGRMRMFNDGGVTSFELTGNDTSTKSCLKPDESPDYEMKIGGEKLFALKLLKDKFQFLVDREGHATISSARSVTVDLATPPQITIRGNVVNKIDGHKEDYIAYDAQKTVGGLYKESSSRKTMVCSGAYNSVVGGPATKNYMRAKVENIRGTALTDLLSTIGKETRVAAGDYSIEIGNPLDLGTPSPLLLAQLKTGDYKVKTFSGDIVLGCTVKGDVKFNTLLGNLSRETIAGNISDSTVAGNVSCGTLLGNASLTSMVGNCEVSTNLGNIQVGTNLGNIDIQTALGTIKLSAGTASIELGPCGIKITNGGIELLTLIQEIITTLSSTTAPGYMAPITSAPTFGTMLPKIIMCKGV